MAKTDYGPILKPILEAAKLARVIGISNLLQPGLVKEMIIADILKHKLITSKRHADACDPKNEKVLFEYLSCKEGGSGQFDRMFARPREKRDKSLLRIGRNNKIYLAIFYAANQTRVKTIYEIDPTVMIAEATRQLRRSRNDISHVGFSEAWALQNGRVVYPRKRTQ